MDIPRPTQERDDPAELVAGNDDADPGRTERWAAWLAENGAAIESMNRWYEKNGHPLANHMILPGGAV